MQIFLCDLVLKLAHKDGFQELILDYGYFLENKELFSLVK